MALPPFDDGAVQASVTWSFPGVAEFRVGAPGTVCGVADSAFDAGPVPAALAAVTANEYATPLVRPVTVHARAPLVEQVEPPGLAVTV